jgi:putative ABC transport system permease protein
VNPRFPGTPLPRSYFEQIKTVPGVELITEVSNLFGYYREPDSGVAAVITRPDVWLAARPGWEYSEEQLQHVLQTPSAALITDQLASRTGIKVGDRFTVHSPTMRKDGTQDWTFEIGGIMSRPGQSDAFNYFLLANWSYFDEARATANGTVGRYLLRIDDPTRSTQISRAIDEMFRNSSAPTQTRSEQAVVESRLADIGDVNFFTRAIIAAVFFALLLLTANSMMQSVRERTAEIGVLKSLGFSDLRVLMLVLVEALLLMLGSAALGLVASALIFPQFAGYLVLSMDGVSTMPLTVVLLGFGSAAAAALLSAAIPAWRARRLSVTAALAAR